METYTHHCRKIYKKIGPNFNLLFIANSPTFGIVGYFHEAQKLYLWLGFAIVDFWPFFGGWNMKNSKLGKKKSGGKVPRHVGWRPQKTLNISEWQSSCFNVLSSKNLSWHFWNLNWEQLGDARVYGDLMSTFKLWIDPYSHAGSLDLIRVINCLNWLVEKYISK